MFIRFFIKNKNDKIEFTEEELRELLDEAYKSGYDEGIKKTWYCYTSPAIVQPDPQYEYTTVTATTNDKVIKYSIGEK